MKNEEEYIRAWRGLMVRSSLEERFVLVQPRGSSFDAEAARFMREA